ncbi:hypothetical protein [Legionella longbeachae]|uniref:Uncharacterized protein n=1 Tax=Legionella longbeachae serogroup 1 (strain NSW150) TaxID=661367 RepID=D3HKB3_LEGLN|nr:hypothetical protein [Legionella longbeachae]VEE03393.1 Uncharacterised protein [Legionella oakridgensis]HBD7397669.1 hypothetical protein [Legionella pneumophila]ARB93713.1 hypothetical protein A6J40_16700 [Legionella longbeachae]ARM33147.1 hypothetical protein B0B39_06265 [Legionella longbeachae]EEZ94005.1 conserved hypothetical protein [Legionella longbeachae D-4968]
MKRLFTNLQPKSKDQLSNAKKEQFEKIENAYDRHDNGNIAEENKITHKDLSKHLKRDEQQEENHNPNRPRN